LKTSRLIFSRTQAATWFQRLSHTHCYSHRAYFLTDQHRDHVAARSCLYFRSGEPPRVGEPEVSGHLVPATLTHAFATHTDAYFTVRQEWPETIDGWLCRNLSAAAVMLSLTVWAFAASVPYAAMVQSPARKSSSAQPAGKLNLCYGNRLSGCVHFLAWHGSSDESAGARRSPFRELSSLSVDAVAIAWVEQTGLGGSPYFCTRTCLTCLQPQS